MSLVREFFATNVDGKDNDEIFNSLFPDVENVWSILMIEEENIDVEPHCDLTDQFHVECDNNKHQIDWFVHDSMAGLILEIPRSLDGFGLKLEKFPGYYIGTFRGKTIVVDFAEGYFA